MQWTIDESIYRREDNLKVIKRLVSKYPDLDNQALASTVTEATGMPTFVAYRLLREFVELSEEDMENIEFLENYYGAKVV